MNGSELNKKHCVFDDILTPEELVQVGLIYVPAFPYEIENGTTINETLKKLKCRFCHSWNEDDKLKAKEAIVRELKYTNTMFIRKVYLTPFADDMNYDNSCYDIGVLVACGKRLEGEPMYNEFIDPHKFNSEVVEQLMIAKKKNKPCIHEKSMIHYRDDYAVGDIVAWKEFCRNCGKLLDHGYNQYVKPENIAREVTISPLTKYDEGYYIISKIKSTTR